MATCLDIEKNFNLHRQWIEKYKNHLEILKKDHELIVKKGFDIFFAVDFFDIYEYCFPYDKVVGRLTDYKDEDKRRKLMELQFARSFLFYGTETKSKVLLPPYADELTDFLESKYHIVKKYKDDKLKRNILEILFKPEKIQDIFSDIKKGSASPEGEIELLEKITKSSSDILFLLSSGFLEGMNVLGDLIKKRSDNDENKSYRILDPQPSEIKCYDDVIKEIGEMNNLTVEKMFIRPRKHIQNKRDAKALQYIVELNKWMQKDRQAIFLASNASYMRGAMKGLIRVSIEGEKYDSIRDFETLYVYLIEIRNIGVPKEKSDQIKILEKIEKSLEEFERFSKLSQDIPQSIGSCGRRKENKSIEICKSDSEDQCPFFVEINDINRRLKRVEELKNEIENINLMRQIKVVLSPLFSDDRRTFLKLEFLDYSEELRAIFSRIRELVEDRDEFIKALEERENQLEDQRLRELFNVSFDSASVQEAFMKIDDILFLIKIPFRICIPGEEFQDMFRDIREKAIAARDEHLETEKISREKMKILNESLREFARFSRKIEDERKYIIWQIIFLYNRRFDLVRIWNDYYRNQIESKEMKRESDYLFCLACYFDMPKNESVFKDLKKVCQNYVKREDLDIRFHHILSLALLRIFENNPQKKRFGYTRENLVGIFEDILNAETNKIDEEFQNAIKNNYCYAMSLMISYQEDKLEYRDQINEIRKTMENMREITKERWLYNMEDTLGYIYLLLAKYFEREKKTEYAQKAKECFKNAEKHYLPHELSMRVKNMRECDEILASSYNTT